MVVLIGAREVGDERQYEAAVCGRVKLVDGLDVDLDLDLDLDVDPFVTIGLH
jgi:hypothetical protein